MNRVGNDTFAVLYEIVADAEKEASLDGFVCFAIGDSIVGNLERCVSLDTGTVAIAEMLAHSGKREMPSLSSARAEVLLATVLDALYADHGQSDEQLARDWALYSPLLGLPLGLEPFDDWDAVLIEAPSHARFVWRNASQPLGMVSERLLKRGLVDDVLYEFLDEMRRQYPDIVRAKLSPR